MLVRKESQLISSLPLRLVGAPVYNSETGHFKFKLGVQMITPEVICSFFFCGE